MRGVRKMASVRADDCSCRLADRQVQDLAITPGGITNSASIRWQLRSSPSHIHPHRPARFRPLSAVRNAVAASGARPLVPGRGPLSASRQLRLGTGRGPWRVAPKGASASDPCRPPGRPSAEPESSPASVNFGSRWKAAARCRSTPGIADITSGADASPFPWEGRSAPIAEAFAIGPVPITAVSRAGITDGRPAPARRCCDRRRPLETPGAPAIAARRHRGARTARPAAWRRRGISRKPPPSPA